jgi:hypothetical protein
MVPVIWALASADVKAGTASAARIAMIAITTSNSISVNAEGLFGLIFMWVFFSAGCSEGCLVAAIDLNRLGGLADRRYQMIVSEDFVLGVLFGLGLGFCS